ncbi:hypothetical protein BKI52_02410 [marine bacterium AO1-C]|nr:hypothetical protein BKI52_02410 [marine bacterium AO1-C]
MNFKIDNMITEEDFLKKVHQESQKWEYHQGKLVDLEKSSANHQRIQENLAELLQLCKDQDIPKLLFIPLTDVYAYPDLMVVSPEAIIYEEPNQAAAVLNPSVVVEIYSPKTKAIDSQDKWAFYQGIVSLEQYVMIDEQRPLLQMFTKHEQGWKLEVFKNLEKTAMIGGQEITLSKIYEGL